MRERTKPLLTIGIIFKNEIRCLERCLEALTPLRKSISCELIMADTGSSDGSRKIAEQYADILFEFPWIGDFSAARNAVMNRASGQWYLTVDADEYLDEDISELVDFLCPTKKQSSELICGVVQRNYETLEMDSRYADFMAIRMIRMSTGLRYQGIIHELWPFEEQGIKEVRTLSHTILHHDGYVEIDSVQGKAKRERNLTLLRKCLVQEPENLKVLLQYIESGKGAENYLEVIRKAIEIIKNKQSFWRSFGPPLMRHAIKTALEDELPEFNEWVSLAESLFPSSPFIQIDIEYIKFSYALKNGNHTNAICYGERYLRAITEFHKDENLSAPLIFGTLLLASPYWEQSLKIYLSDIYIKEKCSERALAVLQDMNYTFMDSEQTGNFLCVLGDLHRLSLVNTTSMIQKLFEDIREPVPSEETAQKRAKIFFETASLAFLSQTRKEEQLEQNFCRPSYMLFLPLINECDIGRGTAVLALQNPEEIKLVLSNVENWEQFPIEALSHALELGIPFPLPENRLNTEEMESLATRLSESMEDFVSWLIDIFGNNLDNSEKRDSLQLLSWRQHLNLAAFHAFGWKTDKTDNGFKLVRLFAETEQKYLSHFYASETLCLENLNLLPAFHRFGWHCTKAFEALDREDASIYIRELKAGMELCPSANVIVENLLEHTPQLKSCEQGVSEELLSLAEQVKKLLSGYPPNHPAVTAIKKSNAYQKVANLIEGNNLMR